MRRIVGLLSGKMTRGRDNLLRMADLVAVASIDAIN